MRKNYTGINSRELSLEIFYLVVISFFSSLKNKSSVKTTMGYEAGE
jgi:hypothetical protein